MTRDTSVSQLKGVGKAMEARLKRLGIETVQDLIWFFPFRYEDFSVFKNIQDIEDGEQVTVKGVVELIANKRSPRKRVMITEAIVRDESGQMKVVWFGQPFIVKNIAQGDVVYFSGVVKQTMFGAQMTSPQYEKEKKAPERVGKIVPVYPLTSGMTQKQMRSLVAQTAVHIDAVPEWLDDDIRDRADVMGLVEALKMIHDPEDDVSLEHALRRLKFDEVFLLQLRAQMIRKSLKRYTAPKIAFQEKAMQEFTESLPFALTNDQKVAVWEIIQDMEKDEPMNRLLEGDVGSGKTVVAAMSSLHTTLAGHQVAVMAPTEVLAKQHLVSFQELVPTQTIALLTSSGVDVFGCDLQETAKNKRRKEVVEMIVKGRIDIVIGTHALLVDDVMFQSLGLVIVDEQHRFGVAQRKTLRERSGNPDTVPHFLSMTATPIPRSFALTIYGDLDISIIKQMPGGRKPIKTRLVQPHNREKAYDFIEQQVSAGRQVFVICPLIQEKEETKESPQDEKKTVLSEYEKLSKQVFPNLRVDYLHGKMKSGEKDEVMKRFSNGDTDILVSTSVIEVGVNIPNATVMMIEDAERFGLAQLHQFRGRVGRSSHQSYCFVFTGSDSVDVAERLEYFETTTDGFALAEYDLERRGPGEVYGTAQSGMGQLRLATMRDIDIIKLARTIAKDIDFDVYPTLKERVRVWEKRVHLE